MSDARVERALTSNLAEVRDRMAEACRRAGRNPADVTLVAVTKTVSADVARALAGLGVADFGENRPQDLVAKAQLLDDLDIRWHMIGHLQRNKVRKVLPYVRMIHSVDSLRLAEAIDRIAADLGLEPEVLVEVNVSGEEAKFGVPRASAAGLVRQIGALEHVHVRGLMTMAPFVDYPETVRPVFAGLRALAQEIAAEAPAGVEMRHLSMGMTQDYVQAIEEGATIVRVGTAIVGKP